MTSDAVEQMIAKKLDLFENGLTMTDAKTKMLSLKVRAQPNQRKHPNPDKIFRRNLKRKRGAIRTREASARNGRRVTQSQRRPQAVVSINDRVSCRNEADKLEPYRGNPEAKRLATALVATGG